MPIENILFLALVFAAFAGFAAVLAYGEWTTRHLATEARPRRASGKQAQAIVGQLPEEPGQRFAA